MNDSLTRPGAPDEGPGGSPSGGAPSDGCLRCGRAMETLGVEEFRVGGTSGGWKLVFGELAELGEGKLPLEVRACQSCGQVDLRVPPGRYP
jgi:hypothetical protein